MASSSSINLSQIGITSLPPSQPNPVHLAQYLIDNFRKQRPNELVSLNLATSNKEDGVLARTMEFAGFSNDGGILVGTDRNTRKYKDILANPNVAVTFLFLVEVLGVNVYQQIRINGVAKECSQAEIEARWAKQPPFAQVRSVVHSQRDKLKGVNEFRDKYQELVNAVEQGKLTVPVPEKTTYLEITPNLFDFYQSGYKQIADRYVYTKRGDDWDVQHFVG